LEGQQQGGNEAERAYGMAGQERELLPILYDAKGRRMVEDWRNDGVKVLVQLRDSS
jgi:hypothetical protein